MNLDLSNALTTAIIVLDTSLCIRYMNAAAEELFAQSYPRVVGKSHECLFHMDSAMHYLTHALKHSDPQTLRECKLKTPHEKVIVDCIASPYLPNGKLEGIIIIIELIRSFTTARGSHVRLFTA